MAETLFRKVSGDYAVHPGYSHTLSDKLELIFEQSIYPEGKPAIGVVYRGTTLADVAFIDKEDNLKAERISSPVGGPPRISFLDTDSIIELFKILALNEHKFFDENSGIPPQDGAQYIAPIYEKIAEGPPSYKELDIFNS